MLTRMRLQQRLRVRHRHRREGSVCDGNVLVFGDSHWTCDVLLLLTYLYVRLC